MNSKLNSIAFAISSGLVFASSAIAQPAASKIDFPQPSPACTIKQRVGLTDVEVTYSRPSAKGREVFGSVVPFEKVWRTGANQATKLVFSTPVKLNGTEVAAGTYALMTIPGKDEWTIIINKGSEQWGAYKYSESDDALRVTVKPTKAPSFTERTTFTVDKSGKVTLLWGNEAVAFTVK
jgi:hypothetical protein